MPVRRRPLLRDGGMGGVHAAPKKPFKCSLGEKSIKLSVAASSLSDLLEVGCQRLKIKKSDVKHIALEDGTIVDDDEYFHSLPADSVMHFVKLPAVSSSSAAAAAASSTAHLRAALEALSSLPRKELLEASRDPTLYHYAEVLRTMAKQVNLGETRDSDPDWFEGVLSRAATKSEVMEQSAQSRLRGYLFEARRKVQEASELTTEQRSVLLEQLGVFQKRLSAAAWHGHYFSRKRRRPDTFCDAEGRFSCEGTHSKDSCDYDHLINPYSCKEDRVLFSTWNLDHQIEKSREIVPEMIKAATLPKKSKPVKWDYFYDLLFTRENLRLVHIVCHDKREHKRFKCDFSKLYE